MSRSRSIPGARWLLLVLALALAGVAAWLVWAGRSSPATWTSSSAEALEELRLGLAAEEKYYQVEAMAHYRHALDLDPDFTVAKLRLARHLGKNEEAGRLRDELRKADLDRLTPRERLLVRHYLLEKDGRSDEARALLTAYLADHPDDPYALELDCDDLWMQARFEKAETCHERLLEVDPNWVTAQNRLGYLAMAQGDLDQAEDRFRTYRYVAPDQANPHDSLGELMVLEGRYDEARAELEEALAIRPDFCISYSNLTNSALYADEVGLASQYAERARAAEGCEELGERLACRVADYALYWERRWPELSARADAPCHEKDYTSPWPPFLAALHTGDAARLDALQARVAEHSDDKLIGGLARSLQGLREMSAGNLPSALDSFRTADETLDYWGLGPGMLKLMNRLMWAEAARRSGDQAEADRLVSEVEAINPSLAEAFREGRIPLPPNP